MVQIITTLNVVNISKFSLIVKLQHCNIFHRLEQVKSTEKSGYPLIQLFLKFHRHVIIKYETITVSEIGSASTPYIIIERGRTNE